MQSNSKPVSLKVADETWLATALLHRESPERDGVPGAPDQHVDRLGYGAVDRRHLVGRDDGDHPNIIATASE